MKRRGLYLPFLLLIFFSLSVADLVSASQQDWTEKKLGQIILKAEKAARQKNWGRAIEYGEKMLKGAQALNLHSDARYINLLKNLNRFYDKAGRLSDVASRVKEAYFLSLENLGRSNETTRMSRLLYYKLLMSDKDYHHAIPLVLENIVILEKGKADDYKLLHYLKQLYSLYGLTGQLEKEETTLRRLLKLNKRLVGDDIEDNINYILILAKNYCLQNKTLKFSQLMTTYNLNYEC